MRVRDDLARLRVTISQHENVIRADSDNDKQADDHGLGKVVDLEDHAPDEAGDGDCLIM